MSGTRGIRKVLKAKPTIEGAGVHLKRAFGFGEVPVFDPFLLFDDFHASKPEHYLKGFPWHPHRGIETITYVLHGNVEHGDSMGNKAIINSDEVQWMTAGSGVIHQEMPKARGRNARPSAQLTIRRTYGAGTPARKTRSINSGRSKGRLRTAPGPVVRDATALGSGAVRRGLRYEPNSRFALTGRRIHEKARDFSCLPIYNCILPDNLQ